MKVTVLNKKTLTVIGLIAMLVVAAIINVSLKGEKCTSQNSDNTNTQTNDEQTQEVETSTTLSAMQTLNKYELERKNTIEKELEYLDELINNENTDEETLKTATEQKMLVMKNLNTERTIAEILVAKGFNGVTVVCGSESVNILVNSSDLDDAKVAQILDITTSETDISAENIKIIPLS